MLPWQLIVLWVVLIIFFYLIFVWFFSMGRLKALFLATFISAIATFSMIQMTDQSGFSNGDKTWIQIIQLVLFLVPLAVALWLIFRHCRRGYKHCEGEKVVEKEEKSQSPAMSPARSLSPSRASTRPSPRRS